MIDLKMQIIFTLHKTYTQIPWKSLQNAFKHFSGFSRSKCVFFSILWIDRNTMTIFELFCGWLTLFFLFNFFYAICNSELVLSQIRACGICPLKSSKKVKNYSRKSRWFKNHAKVNAYFTDPKKIENEFPEDGEI